MGLFKRIINSPDVEHAYNQFMLDFETRALRLTCYFGIFHIFLFLILDYWRADYYTNVLIYRSGSIATTFLILLLSYRKEISVSFYSLLCLLLSTTLPILHFLLDFTAGMPVFFLPNATILFFYVFNACLGHSFKLKVMQTSLLVVSYVFYSVYLSTHQKYHISQVWNLSLNASVSLLISYLIIWFKRLSFVKQEQLLESNSKLDLALKSAEMGIWSVDIKTSTRTFDNKILELLGIDATNFKGSPEEFYNAVHPDDREALQKQIRMALETKNPISPEYRAVWPDGSIHYIKARAKVICDSLGTPVKLKGISWDITDQKKIEQELKDQENALKESESKFRQISDTINDVFYLYNITEKKYEFISKNCESILGASQEFFFSGKKYALNFVIEEDRQKMLHANELVDSGTPYEVEYRINNNGEIKWIREKSFPIKNELGVAIKNSGICTDITHLKLQEIELLNQKHHLETLNNTKDKFFSIVAHDLKSPLNSLKSFTSLLIDHTDRFTKEEIIETGKQAQLAVDDTIKMDDNLITWARLQMGDYETNLEKINFNEVVATILPVYNRIAEKKGIKLSWSFDDTLNVFVDKNHLQFIIRNLLNNAIKFTHKGGVIDLHANRLANNEVQISVSDNGVGIPEEKMNKIFSLGKSQSSRGTAGEKGSGLGLMLCQEFTRLNGGQIEVESKLGRGTTIDVRLKSEPEVVLTKSTKLNS